MRESSKLRSSVGLMRLLLGRGRGWCRSYFRCVMGDVGKDKLLGGEVEQKGLFATGCKV